MTSKRSGNLPFSNPVSDSLDLMKKMWGFAGLPGLPTPASLASMAARVPQQLPNMFAPTLDVNELDKRIADLRAVEQWLELNAGMLRTTIQALEVQRATIATLKGISGAMLSPMFGKADGAAKLIPNPPPEVALGLAAMKADESTAAETKTMPVIPAGRRKKATKRARKQPNASAAAAAPLNPNAWWNTLQDQFTRIAANASAPSKQVTAEKAPARSKQRRRTRA